jgi:diguanylate cyclase (GGDEF)-like protein
VQLDSYTLLVANCGLLVLLGCAFVFIWMRDRRSTWLLWWGIPVIAIGVALASYMPGAHAGDFIPIAFGNAARIAAVGCFWYGIRIFQGRKPIWGSISVLCAGWIALCFYPPFVESLSARIIVASLVTSGLCALSAFELWRDRADGLRSRIPTFAVFCSAAILMFVRAMVSNIAPYPVGALYLDAAWFAVFALLAIGHIVFAAIFFLTMTLERREAEQRNFAMSDPLTGLLNRRAFTDFAQRLSRRRAGLRDPLALLVLDLDHFKAINDEFGHDVGDRMLQAFAEVSEEAVRPTDQLFRMGGEEFCFVFPDTSLEDCIVIAERIRRTFEGVEIDTGAGIAATTVSIGIAMTQHAIDVDVLLAAADAAVYEAKARGRNRVIVAEPSTLLRGQIEAAPKRRRA